MAEWFDQLDQELRLWYHEASQEYQDRGGAVYAAIGDTFDEWDAKLLFRRFTLDEEAALFVVADETTSLVVQLLDDGATVHFLGDVAGGVYVESANYRGDEILVSGTYSHERLPGGNVAVARVVSHGLRRPGRVKSEQRAEALQALFRQWAEAPRLPAKA